MRYRICSICIARVCQWQVRCLDCYTANIFKVTKGSRWISLFTACPFVCDHCRFIETAFTSWAVTVRARAPVVEFDVTSSCPRLWCSRPTRLALCVCSFDDVISDVVWSRWRKRMRLRWMDVWCWNHRYVHVWWVERQRLEIDTIQYGRLTCAQKLTRWAA